MLDFDSYSIEVIGKAHKHRSRPQAGAIRAYDFDESTDTEFVAWWMWPNFSFQNYPGGRVHCWKWTPIDEGHTHLTVDWYFPSITVERVVRAVPVVYIPVHDQDALGVPFRLKPPRHDGDAVE